MDRPGRGVRPALGLQAGHSSRAAQRQQRLVCPQRHRPVRAGDAAGQGLRAGAGGRSPHADPPPVVRPHRASANVGAGAGVCRRSVAACRREAGRPSAGQSALRRAHGGVLARPRALRRHNGLPLRQCADQAALPRVRHQRLQRQSGVRPVHARAARRRPDARRHAAPAHRLRLQPAEHDHARGRLAAQGIHRHLPR